MTLAHWLQRTAHAHSSLPALAVGPTVVARYDELAGSAARLAAGLTPFAAADPERPALDLWRPGQAAPELADPGATLGNVLGIVSESRVEAFEAVLGAWWAGWAVAPLDPGLDDAALAERLALAAPQFLLASPRAGAKAAKAAPPSVRGMAVFGGREHRALRSGAPAPIAQASRSSVAWLHFGRTLRSGGRPAHASLLSHWALMSMALSLLAEVDTLSPRDAQIHAAPWSAPFGFWLAPTIARGGLNVAPESGDFDAAEIFEAAAAWRRAGLTLSPHQLAQLVESDADCDPSAFRAIVATGASATRGELGAALDRFGPRLAQVYGARTHPLAATRLNRHDIADRSDPRWGERVESAGRAFLLTELSIAAPCERTPGARAQVEGEIGEVILHGPCRAMGVLEAAASAEGGRRITIWPGDERVGSGDYGALDAAGLLTLYGRRDERIGATWAPDAWPRDAEAALLALPEVREAALAATPNGPTAFVTGDAPLDAAAARLAALGLDAAVRELDALPRSPCGRLDRAALSAAD